MMYCRLCNQKTNEIFSHQVLKKYKVKYFLCEGCGLLQTEKPYWLDKAYSEAIAVADTGLVARNINISNRLTSLLFLMFGTSGRYLDIAGGTGLLTRLMRDIGFDYYWHDQYCENIHAKGFEYCASLGSCSAVTAFEVLEHLENPESFVVSALNLAQTDTFIFSTDLYAGNPPSPDEWWYYAFETGQHISFYQLRTLKFIGRKLAMDLYSCNNFHVFTKQHFSHRKFQLCMGRLGKLISLIIRRRINSRTMTDHKTMLHRTCNFEKR